MKKTLIGLSLFTICSFTVAGLTPYAEAANYKQQNNYNQLFRFQDRTYQINNNAELINLLRIILAYLVDIRGGNMGSGNQSTDIEVDTRSATSIEDNRVTVHGVITDFGNSDFADVWFEYGTSLASFSRNTTIQRISDNEEDELFDAVLTGLQSDTTYRYRAVGRDEDGFREYGNTLTFKTDDDDDDDDNDDDEDEPIARTNSARNITNDSAALRGEVDMRDANNGEVFFVYGEDRDLVDDVDNEYDRYTDVEESGDDLQKVLEASDFDGNDTFERTVSSLDNDTKYYFLMCVGFEDEDDEPEVDCGDTESFTTDS